MRATNLKSWLAVSILLLTMVCTTVPAWADVNITAAQVGDTNEVIISFDSRSEANLVRTYALDARPDNKANISEVTDTNECMMDTHPDYGDWVDWGRPPCWCYAKQCRGDTNGSLFLGKPITGADLIIFKCAFNRSDDDLRLWCPSGICADLNHTAFLGKRVTGADLIIFKTYFGLLEFQIPGCDPTHISYWCTPGNPCPP